MIHPSVHVTPNFIFTPYLTLAPPPTNSPRQMGPLAYLCFVSGCLLQVIKTSLIHALNFLVSLESLEVDSSREGPTAQAPSSVFPSCYLLWVDDVYLVV